MWNVCRVTVKAETWKSLLKLKFYQHMSTEKKDMFADIIIKIQQVIRKLKVQNVFLNFL